MKRLAAALMLGVLALTGCGQTSPSSLVCSQWHVNVNPDFGSGTETCDFWLDLDTGDMYGAVEFGAPEIRLDMGRVKLP
jgi:hypothetical protein